jgi:hypothetical protein
MFASPDIVPVDRLVRNTESYLAKHSTQPDAHYRLARIHYLAFHLKRNRVPTHKDADGNPDPVAQWELPPYRHDRFLPGASVLPNQQLVDHAAKALRAFNDAVRLAPGNGLYHLGRASLLEEFYNWKANLTPARIPSELEGITITQVRQVYSKAFSLAMIEDSKLRWMPASGYESITAHEAAIGLVRLASRSSGKLSQSERAEVERANTAIAQFQALEWVVITPIVFSFKPVASLDELLDPDSSVDFDLRGYGARDRWPWVKPELGFLVWDPREDGSIRSARELFGSYTFQIFWDTGYDALGALDDNGDGVLHGRELEGISVWFDRDSDGQARPGEVVPLRLLDIVSIATTATSSDGIHPTNARGITLKNERTLRTWDWMVTPIRNETVAGADLEIRKRQFKTLNRIDR